MHMGGYQVITRGCSVHQRDTMSTQRVYFQYTGGCSVHQSDTMSTLGAYLQYTGGC